MKKIILTFICFSALNISTIYSAPIETFKFSSTKQEVLFHKLNEEIRCLVCQNQSIAESNAGLAKDLRQEIYEMINQGKTEEQIINFMVKRYGDYVLYRPPFKPLTWLLWFGPLIAFMIGLFFVLKTLKEKERTQKPLNEEERQRIEQLHQQQGVPQSQDKK